MSELSPLEVTANAWAFLRNPERYVEASERLSKRPLAIASARRQLATAQDILNRLKGAAGEKPRRGILLADDVGLGKTTIGALVAWCIARGGGRSGVRVLVPNDVMRRRWEEELERHVPLLEERAERLGASKKHIKGDSMKKLSAGCIQVVNHSYASKDRNLSCDLLIVDEAHRAKGDQSTFASALKRQAKNIGRILFLTATPFSIQLKEFVRMLQLIGASNSLKAVRAYDNRWHDLYEGDCGRGAPLVADRLASAAEAAVFALSEVVIRHRIEDLKPAEQALFAPKNEPVRQWNEDPPIVASEDELAILLRIDRTLSLVKKHRPGSKVQTNDPRFHVGWQHLDDELTRLTDWRQEAPKVVAPLVDNQIAKIQKLRVTVGRHTKMMAVGSMVKAKIDEGEKVVLFCFHHATAQELAQVLDERVGRLPDSGEWRAAEWRAAWVEVLPPEPEAAHDHKADVLHNLFIDWLCSPGVRRQVAQWLRRRSAGKKGLADLLRFERARSSAGPIIATEAKRLFQELTYAKSSKRAVLLAAARDGLERMPGGGSAGRVLAVSREREGAGNTNLFLSNQEPDTAVAIFNSAFGPDVLVTTDKLSEGIDLHRSCRLLIHYELAASPIRTVQRNGRLRRIYSWAQTTGKPIEIAYPAFVRTRDQRLVQIMRRRLDNFSILLGGVAAIQADGSNDQDEAWRDEVVAIARRRLEKCAGLLRTRIDY